VVGITIDDIKLALQRGDHVILRLPPDKLTFSDITIFPLKFSYKNKAHYVIVDKYDSKNLDSWIPGVIKKCRKF
jgi:hypothetical protein